MQREATVLLVGALAIASLGTVAAQESGLTSADLTVDSQHYEVRGGNGTADMVVAPFTLTYRYERGAIALRSVEIKLGLKESPAGFAASLSKSSFDVDPDPQGGSATFETQVSLLPKAEASGNESIADYGVVKLVAYAHETGTVESAEGQAQQIVPLRIGGPDNASESGSPSDAAAASSSGAGAAPAATGAIGGVLGAIVGALAATRLL